MTAQELPVGVLNDESISAALAWSPPLITNSTPNSVQACSYDLRVGTVFDKGAIIRLQTVPVTVQQVTVEPGGIISLFTHEELQLPAGIMATAFPMNFWSSQGLLVLNPGHIDPGFHGPLSVRLVNVRSTPKNINLGDPIFTVIFEKLPKAAVKPYNKFKTRDEREREHNSQDVEQNPRGLGQLILRGESPPIMSIQEVNNAISNYNPPIMSQKDVRDAISSYWGTKFMLVATVVATLAAMIAVIQAFRDKGESPRAPAAAAAPANANVPATGKPNP
jgi:deoxycytidine triphosphate deaminase